ncbi:hypothetical protein GCM10027568_29120 [Humibacter soli]
MIAHHPTWHVEMHQATAGGVIRVSCDCPIGEEHDYATWVDMVAGSATRHRIHAVWARHPEGVRRYLERG